ncbi:hypothetical protein [Clostridium kluyveri]|uniref:hypothetical protein n=1 Tax=Clostridium kluyveri TaxID=1534 RepID=UPI00224552FB|nr:hypothetical protein [Clostridium kluyveri]UZQ49850.1 hypothetical protein OP486_18170 [Clostridium kluyveri]
MVEIHLGITCEDNKVIVDGKDITGYLTKIKVGKTPSTIPIIELGLISDKVKITGEATLVRDKRLDEYTKEELVSELERRKQVIINDNLVLTDSGVDKIAEKLVEKLNEAVLNI